MCLIRDRGRSIAQFAAMLVDAPAYRDKVTSWQQ
jgi:hypothetical protein